MVGLANGREVLVQPTLGVYDPALNVYETVAFIEGAGFISDAILANGALVCGCRWSAAQVRRGLL